MRSLIGDLLQIRLAEQPEDKLHKQLYNAIRLTILDGSLVPMSRLPPSRDLAQQLGFSRNTILTVYEQLLAEGYIVSRQGSGTFIAQTLPDTFFSSPEILNSEEDSDLSQAFSLRGQTLLNHSSASPQQWGAFIPGVPDVTAFPHALFSKIQARISRRPGAQQLTYSCQGGSPDLQLALADYLRVARSVHCSPDQILITEGIHQAFDLISRMLCNPATMPGLKSPLTGEFAIFCG